jgi:hypothetical protein
MISACPNTIWKPCARFPRHNDFRFPMDNCRFMINAVPFKKANRELGFSLVDSLRFADYTNVGVTVRTMLSLRPDFLMW